MSDKRKIGNSELIVSAVGLGCMGLSQSYPPFPEKEESIRFLRRAVEMGQTFFDTSEAYAAGSNEELVGEALAPVREKMAIPSGVSLSVMKTTINFKKWRI